MREITYIKGDATKPVGDGQKIIAHCCNDIGAWGAGFVLALSRRWKDPQAQYLAWADGKITEPKFELGAVQFVPVTDEIVVANIIGQRGCGARDGVPPIRYLSLADGFGAVADYATEHGASVHMPRIGCGLAGGQWSMVEKVIVETLIKSGVSVFVYDF